MIYSHFWNDEIEDFSYYRVPLLPTEIFEYVEASIAFHQFDSALDATGSFEVAADAISDKRLASRMLDYQAETVDGNELDIRGCFASFLRPELEALVCGNRRERYEQLPKLGSERDQLGMVVKIASSFRIVVRSLSVRGHGRPPIGVENEYDVQDLLFVILRSVFDDAREEEWTPSHSGDAKRIDILIPSIGVALETKCIRDRRHAKVIANELKVDIESYHSHPACRHLVALVYDPKGHIVDGEVLSRDLSGLRVKGTHTFDVEVVVV